MIISKACPTRSKGEGLNNVTYLFPPNGSLARGTASDTQQISKYNRGRSSSINKTQEEANVSATKCLFSLSWLLCPVLSSLCCVIEAIAEYVFEAIAEYVSCPIFLRLYFFSVSFHSYFSYLRGFRKRHQVWFLYDSLHGAKCILCQKLIGMLLKKAALKRNSCGVIVGLI